MKRIEKRVLPSKYYSKQSFSQFGEDMLLAAFYEEKKRHKGFYVDIGAHHPLRFSNTAYFYKIGWKGINIEPTPNLMPAFNRYRQRDTNLNVGIADEAKEMIFYKFNEPAVNTFSKKQYLKFIENKNYKLIEKQNITTYKLSDILDNYLQADQKIDLINIDAEGFDLNVLKSNNWDKYRADYVFTESSVIFENLNLNHIYIFMRDQNYELVARTRRTFLFRNTDI